MSGQPTIAWTPEMLARFKKEYAKHSENRNDVFEFDGHQFVVGYAKYLIEYLEGLFDEHR